MKTQVVWVEGITAFTLGDLETQNTKKKSITPSKPEGIEETLGKRLHFSSERVCGTPVPVVLFETWFRLFEAHTSRMRLPVRAWGSTKGDSFRFLARLESIYSGSSNPKPPYGIAICEAQGRVNVLELSVLEDEARTTTELGYPIQRVLALDQLDHCVISHESETIKPSHKRVRPGVLKASTWYGSSRVVAS